MRLATFCRAIAITNHRERAAPAATKSSARGRISPSKSRIHFRRIASTEYDSARRRPLRTMAA
jgi:hypothetical protein